MLAYVFRPLKKDDYKKLAFEQFDDVLDLYGKILVIGLKRLIRQGFFRDYIRKTESGSSIRGKINLKDSIKLLSSRKKQLNFTYNEYSMNNYLNQIIKSTLLFLIKSDIEEDTKKNIRRILLYFSNVETLDVKSINWKIRYYRNNQEYKMIITFCKYAINEALPTEVDGTDKLMHFTDEYIYALYEEFIRKYYEKQCRENECYENLSVDRFYLDWAIDKSQSDEDDILPRMETDIVLYNKNENKYLIIDAKYYGEIFTRKRKGSRSLRSGHLYQIFAYVKTKAFELKEESHKVSGMLLYAGTNESDQPDVSYMVEGNRISVKTLDLNKEKFEDIETQLDQIALGFLEGKY